MTVVVVPHDLTLAARSADHLVGGEVHASAEPAEVLTEEPVRAGVDSRIIIDPTSGTLLMLPLGRDRLASDPRKSG